MGPSARSASAFGVVVERRVVGRDWDAFVAAAVGGHHVQTSLWAEVKTTVGWEPAWVIVRRQGSIVGGVQLLSRAVGRFGRIAFGARGPLLETDDPRALDLLVSAIDWYGRENKVRYIKLQPPAGREDLVPSLRRRGWTPSLLEAAPVATVRLDLNKSEDELLAGMHRTRRRLARNSASRGISVRSGEAADLETFYQILTSTAARRGFLTYPRHYFETMYRVFTAHGNANLLIADLENEPVAANLVLAYGDSAVYKIGGSAGSTDARPSVALHWSAIRWAKQQGYRWYDLEGIPKQYAEALQRDGSLPEEASHGVSGFKLSFGGQVELFPQPLDRSPGLLLRPAVKLLAPRIDPMPVRAIAERLVGRQPRTAEP